MEVDEAPSEPTPVTNDDNLSNNSKDETHTEKDNKTNEIKNIELNEKELMQMSQEELINLCLKKDKHIRYLGELLSKSNTDENNSNESIEIQSNYENKLKQQQLESIRKENILIMRLTLKEQELQDCLSQIEALKKLRIPSKNDLQSYLLDPALNYMFERMKKEVDTAKAKVEEMQSEMNAWKFSANSITGKQLMAKCRLLHQENEELGKMISSGKIAKLESGLAIHKNYSEVLKKSQSEIEEVLMEMEEDIEGFQNTVYFLQQQLIEYKEKNTELEKIVASCKSELNSEPSSNDNPIINENA